MSNASNRKSAFYLRQGIRLLSKHNPVIAVKHLQKAVEMIPPSCGEELSKALYWLSIALFRLDQRDLAIKSLASAQKIRRQGFARNLYRRSINEYGMVKRPTQELDDLYAFVSIQIASYIAKKPNSRFESHAEHAAVLKLILESWEQLRTSGMLESLECGEKLQLFKKIKIDFPAFSSYFATIRPKRSSRQTNVEASGYCDCGSHLPYHKCCGRIPGISEI